MRKSYFSAIGIHFSLVSQRIKLYNIKKVKHVVCWSVTQFAYALQSAGVVCNIFGFSTLPTEVLLPILRLHSTFSL
jgi:hypothetical protein